eukprot:CAMPEP_0179312868 /NCGR_PEP_ID=MMETSP0797-20121207/53504_1 /TAXON_ID=47934 /ORGANISM="Dinophysis acuminata, Strain DAEP01" /LENGTH=73 /DNA_ID=CAMNT_0021022847 /DNA_START=67 /DNA_END=284 /DNA_ORIENTATION=+
MSVPVSAPFASMPSLAPQNPPPAPRLNKSLPANLFSPLAARDLDVYQLDSEGEEDAHERGDEQGARGAPMAKT